MKSLIEQLERAIGPHRLLDEEIALASGWSREKSCGRLWWINGGESVASAPNFTSSLDDALTLVPDGWWLTLQCKGKHYHADLEYTGPGEVEGPDDVHSYNKPLPAIAVCIAALKARAI